MFTTRQLVTIPVVAASFLALVTISPVVAGSVTRLEARLAGSAEGNGDFRIEDTGRRTLKLQVEQAGTGTVTFSACGATIGTATLDLLGGAQIERDTAEGQTVPNCGQGSSATVTRGGQMIASGTFAPKN